MVMLTIVSIWAAAAMVLLIFLAVKHKRTYRKTSEIMEKIIGGQKITEVPFNEAEYSLFSHQLKTISEKLEFEVGRADAEKEQIKQLISDLSHQLKTPLANLMMYEEILDSDGLTEEKRARFMRKLKAQSEKINWLLESLFKMTKLEQNVITFDLFEAGIKDTIRSAVSAVFEKAEKKNIRVCVAEFEDARLLHNPKWTAEVFENVLENAIKYTPECGKVEISLERLETYSMIHFKDNGMGISKEEIPYLFDRFYRSKRAEQTEGTGIGLYLSKMILEKEKGYMTVRSKAGRGSVFTVFLQNC